MRRAITFSFMLFAMLNITTDSAQIVENKDSVAMKTTYWRQSDNMTIVKSPTPEYLADFTVFYDIRGLHR